MKLSRPMTWRSVALLGLVALVALGLAVRRPRAMRTPPGTITVAAVVCDATLVERGIVEAAEAIPVRMGTSGDILEITPSGTPVSAGTPVLRVDDADLASRLDEDTLNIQLEELEATVRTARRIQVQSEQTNRLAAVHARLRLAQLEGRILRAGLPPDELRLLEIEHRQTELDWLDAHEETARQQRLFDRGFVAEAVLERTIRREATARAALDEKSLQIELRNRGARAEDLIENQRTIERHTADLERGASALARRLAQIDADIAVGRLQLGQRRFEQARNEEDRGQTVTVAPTNGVLRVRMYTNWRLGGTWQPYSAGARKGKFDTVADVVGRDVFRVDLMLHESDVHRVQVGAPVRLRIGALPGLTFAGRITTVGGIGRDRQDVAPRGYEDSPSGVTMFNAEVRFDNPGDVDLRPGMSVLAEVVTEPAERRLLVPLAAVGRQGDGYAVRRVDGRSHPRSTPQSIGGHPFDAHRFLVETGLAEGDIILERWDTDPEP